MQSTWHLSEDGFWREGVCLALLTSVSRALAHVRCLVPRANKGNNVSGGRTATIKEVQKDKVFFGGWGGSQQK